MLIAANTLPVSAQNAITIEDRGAQIEFPDRITFRAHVESDADIAQVVLEYGVEKLTCGKVTAKAFPDFTQGKSVDVSWTWEMLKSGSEPPGAQIWYRWRVVDTAGIETVSDEQRITWLDDQHAWQSISRDMLTLHWYASPREFAEDLLDSAVDSLAKLAQTTGVKPQSPINMYIYANTADMRDAILYEPGWTGGLAYPDSDILVIGISAEQVDWGKDTEAHELTHVLVGHLTFSCLSSIPTWLNEGIAVYAEGGPDTPARDQLQAAIDADELLPVRALSGGFSEHPDKADLSYAQSFSLVNYLVAEYGQEQLLTLFRNLRDGMTIEDALNDVYGFGLDGLEDGWRTSVGAQPRRAEGAAPTPTPIPTPVPTYQPISGAPIAPAVDATGTVLPARTTAPAEVATEAPTEIAPVQEAPVASSSGPIGIVFVVVVLAGIAAVYLSIQRKKIS
jgi:hypothetical protein